MRKMKAFLRAIRLLFVLMLVLGVGLVLGGKTLDEKKTLKSIVSPNIAQADVPSGGGSCDGDCSSASGACSSSSGAGSCSSSSSSSSSSSGNCGSSSSSSGT